MPSRRSSFSRGGARAVALLLWTAAAIAPTAAEDLTILHVNDVHSRFEPINERDAPCSPEDAAARACFGGIARLWAAVDAARAADPDALLVDAGDQFQGSLFFTRYEGRVSAEFMNALRVDAMAVGNHEFDAGPVVLGAFADLVRFPLLLANADVAAEPALANKLRPWTVVTRNGTRIGIVGLAPANTAELSSPGKRVSFGDPVPAATRAVAALQAAGVERVVLLSHSGYEADKRLAAGVDGIDVIVGGHSHTLLSNTAPNVAGPYPTLVRSPSGRDVPIVQAGAYGKYLGRLVVSFDDRGKVVRASGEPIRLDASVPEDAGAKARVAELAKPLEALRAQVVGRTAAPVDGGRDACRLGGCPMGALVADAMLERVAAQGIAVAVTNGGGLRASLDAGPVTTGEVLTVLPFNNALATFRLKGADLVAALEAGVSKVEERAGRFPQVAGLQVDWSPQGVAGVNRVRAVRVRDATGAWAPIEPERLYGVVSNDYLRRGGDGYAAFARHAVDAYDFGPSLDAVLVDFLAKQPGPYQPVADGRIRNTER